MNCLKTPHKWTICNLEIYVSILEPKVPTIHAIPDVHVAFSRGTDPNVSQVSNSGPHYYHEHDGISMIIPEK